MCGRYSVLTEDEIIEVREIIKNFALRMARDELDDIDNVQREVFPTNRSPIITSNTEEITFQHAQFGFERWDGKGVIINARAETAHEKSMFKKHVDKGRCVVPASGYFEWKAPDEGQKKKVKHLIKDTEGNLLFMAALWRNGRSSKEFVIITKEPYGEIKEIHDRMPVMLRTDQLEQWLNGSIPIEALAAMDYECAGEPCEAMPPVEQEDSEQISLF